MVVIITGASHTGKTLLAQRLLEKYKYTYFSIDHLKMGLIRSRKTDLTPEEDNKLTNYLWPIIREIIKTVIENCQNLIVEGGYVPFNYKKGFDRNYLSSIKFICLAMTEKYIKNHFDDILKHESEIESRLISSDCTINSLKLENDQFIRGFRQNGESVTLIEDNYEDSMKKILDLSF